MKSKRCKGCDNILYEDITCKYWDREEGYKEFFDNENNEKEKN